MLKTLEDVIERPVQVIRPQKVFLFGSRARNDAEPDSDIDLLVVADLPGTRIERTAMVSRALRPRDVSLDLLVYTPQEFDLLAREPGSFVRYIIEKGRLIHDAEDRTMA
jgi:predicted nucleotidyltransferase